MFLNPTDSFVEIGQHFGNFEFCNGPRTDGEYGVPSFAKRVKSPGPLMITNLAPIGMPRPTNDIHDAKAVGSTLRRENIHQQADAMRLAVHYILMLHIGQLLSGRRMR